MALECIVYIPNVYCFLDFDKTYTILSNMVKCYLIKFCLKKDFHKAI